MRKIGVIIAIAIALTLVGCASSGGSSKSSGGGAALAPYSVDISTLPLVKNEKPFTRKYDDLMIRFPELPVDVTQYSRVTITCKYYDENGVEIPQGDWHAMVSLVYDPSSSDRGPEMGPGGNAPLKEFNVGGYSGLVHQDRGVRMLKLKQAPKAILFQSCDDETKYIEVTGITFHNKTASGAE
jgi:hypothetical protein